MTTVVRQRAAQLALLPPVIAGAVYVAFVLRYLDQLILGAFWNSDVASLPVVAASMGTIARGAGDFARVSVASYYSTFIVDLATKWLPEHRLIWEGLSLIASALGIGLMAWAARRASSRQAGLWTFTIAAAASPIVLYSYVALRGPTWFGLCLLGAGLVLLASTKTTPAVTLAIALALGIVAGVSVASDPLFAACGLAPFIGTAVLVWLLRRDAGSAAVARWAGAGTFVALLSAGLTYKVMPLFGFKLVPALPVALAKASQVPANLRYLGEDILAFGNVQYPKPPVGMVSLPGIVALALCAAALGALIRFLPPLLRRRSPAGTAERPAKELALTLLLVYWVLVAFGDAGAFVFSNLPVAGVGTARYLVPVFLALAALAALWATDSGWGRVGTAAMATTLAVLSTIGMVQLVASYKQAVVVIDGPKVLDFVRAEGITKGYGGYWDAIGLTWRNNSPVRIYPVEDCTKPAGPQLCQFYVNNVTTWYRPQAGIRSFVLVNTSPIPYSLTGPPPASLGPPAQVQKVGYYTVYVYDYDVGALIRGAIPPGKASIASGASSASR